MGLPQYNLGRKHGRLGVRAFARRRARHYLTESGNRSYLQGYKLGARERLEREGKVGLDYKNPLNNQLFIPTGFPSADD